MREMTLQQCLAPADAVCYFHSPGGTTLLRDIAAIIIVRFGGSAEMAVAVPLSAPLGAVSVSGTASANSSFAYTHDCTLYINMHSTEDALKCVGLQPHIARRADLDSTNQLDGN